MRFSLLNKGVKTTLLGLAFASFVTASSYASPEVPIRQAIYLHKVLEYCGGDSWHTDQGYRLLRSSLNAKDQIAQQSDFDSVVKEIESWLLDRQGAEFSVWCESKTAGAKKYFIDQWSNKMDADLDDLIASLLE